MRTTVHQKEKQGNLLNYCVKCMRKCGKEVLGDEQMLPP